jgi:transcriptional regulator with GAF, ATPase, and Fis domain
LLLFCFRNKIKMLMPNGSPREKASIAMKSSSSVQLHASAFLYDHLKDLPVWIRKLTPGQLENIARVMIAWHATIGERADIVPIDEIERREVIRAITLSGGDVMKAARALRMGRTTIYRKLRQWGYSVENRLLIHQASALAETPLRSSAHWK